MFKFFWQFLRPYKWWYLLMFQAPVLSGFYFIIYNYGIKLTIDAVTTHETFNYKDFIYPVGAFIFSEVYVNTIWRLSNFAYLRSLPYTKSKIFNHITNHILHYNYKFFQDYNSGSIISKTKGIIEGFSTVFNIVHHQASVYFIHTVFPIIAIATVSIKLSFVIFISTAVFIWIMYKMSKKLDYLSELEGESYHTLLGNVSDCISNIFTLFAFSSRKFEINSISKFTKQNCATREINTVKQYIKIQLVGMTFYIYILSISISYCIYLRYYGGLSVANFVFVLGLVWAAIDHSWRFTDNIQNFIRAIGSLRSSMELLEYESLNQNINLPDISIVKSDIKIQNLTFYYPKEKALKTVQQNNDSEIIIKKQESRNIVFNDFNLTIPAGQKVGLVGSSGSGKSTLVSLLLKNFIPCGGSILIDNQDISKYNEDSLRNQIAIIPQDTVLFHRSIFENIAYESLVKNNIDFSELIADVINAYIFKNYTLNESQISYTPILFNESGFPVSFEIKYNVDIKYGKSEKLIIQNNLQNTINKLPKIKQIYDQTIDIAKKVRLHDIIEKMPQKYLTQVGERGVKISGGQRQRIAIARAMMKNAKLLILDEATSSLDTLTEIEIQQSIDQILHDNNITLIAIAHRLSTIKNLDRIIVMNNGRVIEDGNFNDLLQIKNGHFNKLWQTQINGILG